MKKVTIKEELPDNIEIKLHSLGTVREDEADVLNLLRVTSVQRRNYIKNGKSIEKME